MTYTAISFGLFLLNFTLKCAFSEPASVLRNSCVNHVLLSKRFLQSGPNLKKSDYSRTDVMAYGIAFYSSIHWPRKIKVGTLTLVNFALSAWIILLSGTRTRNEKSNTGRIDLKPSPACSPFNSEQDIVLLLYPVTTCSIRSMGETLEVPLGSQTFMGASGWGGLRFKGPPGLLGWGAEGQFV